MINNSTQQHLLLSQPKAMARRLLLLLMALSVLIHSVRSNDPLLSPKGVNYEGKWDRWFFLVVAFHRTPARFDWFWSQWPLWCRWRGRWGTRLGSWTAGISTRWIPVLGWWLGAPRTDSWSRCMLIFFWFFFWVDVNGFLRWRRFDWCSCGGREMANNGLSGTLSPSVGNLSHLQTMWVLWGLRVKLFLHRQCLIFSAWFDFVKLFHLVDDDNIRSDNNLLLWSLITMTSG